jgi:hypothetical protein
MEGGGGSVVRERWREERWTEREQGMRRKRSQGAVEGDVMDRGGWRQRSQGAVEGGVMVRGGAGYEEEE